MKKYLAAFAFVITISAMANEALAPIPSEQFLTDKITVDIARATLSVDFPSNKPTPAQIDQRSRLVKEWLSTVGGDKWYANWLERFGIPKTKEALVIATLIGLSDKRLGRYYLTNLPVSPASMKGHSCGAPQFDISPTLKAFCALANRDAAIVLNDSQSLADFRGWAKWFLKNQKDGRWEWSFDFPGRNQKAPWISGLTQSLGISVLLREYQLGDDPEYLKVAGMALRWLRKPVAEGGIAVREAQGTWYEEYPEIKNPSHVLNGHMWALFGIWDYYRVTGDQAAKQMFDQGISILKADLHKYDVGNWSVYAQTNRVDFVTGNYQQFIIEQLRVLHAITGDSLFDKYATKWANSMHNDGLFVGIAANEFLKANPEIARGRGALKSKHSTRP